MQKVVDSRAQRVIIRLCPKRLAVNPRPGRFVTQARMTIGPAPRPIPGDVDDFESE